MSATRSPALPLLALLLATAGSPVLADSMAASRQPVAKAQTGALTLAPSKHNGSGVALRYGTPTGLQPGAAGRVQVQLSNVTAVDGARVEVRSVATGATLLSTTLQRGETRLVDIDVPPQPDGMQYLSVVTTQAGRSSLQSIPLKVGSGRAAMKVEGQPQTTPTGEKVISLPSQ